MLTWNKQRVLITGGAGFFGQHLVRQLEAKQPAALIVPRSEEYDLRDGTAVRYLLKAARPTLVIHLAAVEGGIAANHLRPAEFFYDNAMMGVQLLHESWQAGVDKFVGIGTVAAYPKFAPVPFHEADLWNGFPDRNHAPYGIAKKLTLIQGQAYRQQYDFNAIYLVPVNLYGPGDNFDPETARVIPALIRRCLEAKAADAPSITVWGDGSPTREFLYVEEAAAAVVLAAEKYDSAEPVNIGTGVEISIRELAEQIAALTGYHGEIVWDSSKPGGQPRRALDVSRAAEQFDFRASVALKDGLQKTIDWYMTQ